MARRAPPHPFLFSPTYTPAPCSLHDRGLEDAATDLPVSPVGNAPPPTPCALPFPHCRPSHWWRGGREGREWGGEHPGTSISTHDQYQRATRRTRRRAY